MSKIKEIVTNPFMYLVYVFISYQYFMYKMGYPIDLAVKFGITLISFLVGTVIYVFVRFLAEQI